MLKEVANTTTTGILGKSKYLPEHNFHFEPSQTRQKEKIRPRRKDDVCDEEE